MWKKIIQIIYIIQHRRTKKYKLYYIIIIIINHNYLFRCIDLVQRSSSRIHGFFLLRFQDSRNIIFKKYIFYIHLLFNIRLLFAFSITTLHFFPSRFQSLLSLTITHHIIAYIIIIYVLPHIILYSKAQTQNMNFFSSRIFFQMLWCF